MMAQKTGYYTEDYRKRPVQTDAPRDYIDRFTQLFVVTDYAMGGDMEADERQSRRPLGIRSSGIRVYRYPLLRPI